MQNGSARREISKNGNLIPLEFTKDISAISPEIKFHVWTMIRPRFEIVEFIKREGVNKADKKKARSLLTMTRKISKCFTLMFL